MAASLRVSYAGKKLPYLTVLKNVARDASHGSNEHQTCLTSGHAASHIPGTELQIRPLEDELSKLRLQTIGYEDKRSSSDKPKPSHPGEYVTVWGDFRPQPSPKGQTKPSTHKSTSTTVSLLLSRPEESAWTARPVHHERQKSFTFSMGMSGSRATETNVRATAWKGKGEDGVSKSAILSAALSSSSLSVLGQVNVEVFGQDL